MENSGDRIARAARTLTASAGFRARFEAWRDRFPALRLVRGPEDLLHGLRRRPHHVSEGVLAAIVSLVGKGDQDASLVLLELLRPGIALRVGWFDGTLSPDDAWQEMAAAILETARRYDACSRNAGIARDLLRKAWRDAAPKRRRHVERRGVEGSLTEIVEEERAEVWEDPLPSARMLIAQAEQSGAVSPDEAALIRATRLDGLTLQDVSRGEPYHQTVRRRREAEARLSEFAREKYAACVKSAGADRTHKPMGGQRTRGRPSQPIASPRDAAPPIPPPET